MTTTSSPHLARSGHGASSPAPQRCPFAAAQDEAGEDHLPPLPFGRPSVLDIPPLFLQLQQADPVARVRTPAGDPAWLVTRYEHVRALLADKRLARLHPEPERAARFSDDAFHSRLHDLGIDNETHARLRRVLTSSFNRSRVHAMAPRISSIVDDLLTGLAQATPPVDFHERFSVPLPVMVLCELLGVPYEDRRDFCGWSTDAANMVDRKRALTALGALMRYVRGMIERKRRAPAEDFISYVVASSDERGQLTEDEMMFIVAMLLFAGHETTTARLDFGLLLLLTHPEQRDALQRDPALASSVVEEIVRVSAPNVGVIARYATADIEVGAVTVREGDLVLLSNTAANRDPSVFERPGALDVHRNQAHLGFGYGNHFCVGASLARLELQATFSTLLQRLPTLRLAVPIEELRLREHTLAGGIHELPVAW
jgi:pentalenolactone synthase